MSVAARFYVSTITRHAHQPGHVAVILNVVSRGPENKTWASATPIGRVELTIGNEAAAKWFVDRLGQDVACTFEDRPLDCARCGEPSAGGSQQYSQEALCKEHGGV